MSAVGVDGYFRSAAVIGTTPSYLTATAAVHSSRHDRPNVYIAHMKVEEIAEAIAKLPPDQLARFRRWFTTFEAGRADHAAELDSTAFKLGRLAGRTFTELKKRVKEP